MLFVCAAGNSDSSAAFDEDIPASFLLPNLITVGAVDKVGQETDFSSYGPTVLVDANGFMGDSLDPGGSTLRLSGTSMASPQVTDLAAKLLALDATLSANGRSSSLFRVRRQAPTDVCTTSTPNGPSPSCKPPREAT